jgi:hypothetical protein
MFILIKSLISTLNGIKCPYLLLLKIKESILMRTAYAAAYWKYPLNSLYDRVR